MRQIITIIALMMFHSFAFAGVYETALDAFNSRNYSYALKQFQTLALRGDPRAQNTLALMYINGYGIRSNPAKAEKLLLSAANNGNVHAQTNLGKYYEMGYAGIPNYIEAYKWYNIAASQGDPRSQYLIGKLYLSGKGVVENQETAFEYFVQSAEQGYEAAHRILVLQYRYMVPLK